MQNQLYTKLNSKGQVVRVMRPGFAHGTVGVLARPTVYSSIPSFDPQRVSGNGNYRVRSLTRKHW
jgi:hypothetical protein